MNILGIDPGLSGALAVCRDGSCVDVVDVPTVKAARKGNEVDVATLATLLRDLSDNNPFDHVFIERVGAMPGQGVSSMFKFGFVAGVLRGLVAGYEVPTTYVTPVSWKRALQVQGGKDASRARASELMPSAALHWGRVKDEGRAEAALIAFYGWQQLTRQEAA